MSVLPVLPPNAKHTLYLLVVAAGGAFAALEPWEPWKWLGVAVSLCGALGNALTMTSAQAAKIAALRHALGGWKEGTLP